MSCHPQNRKVQLGSIRRNNITCLQLLVFSKKPEIARDLTSVPLSCNYQCSHWSQWLMFSIGYLVELGFLLKNPTRRKHFFLFFISHLPCYRNCFFCQGTFSLPVIFIFIFLLTSSFPHPPSLLVGAARARSEWLPIAVYQPDCMLHVMSCIMIETRIAPLFFFEFTIASTLSN